MTNDFLRRLEIAEEARLVVREWVDDGFTFSMREVIRQATGGKLDTTHECNISDAVMDEMSGYLDCGDYELVFRPCYNWSKDDGK